MASEQTGSGVKPLPKFVIQLGLAGSFVFGHVLLWNDRRINRNSSTETDIEVDKPMGMPAYK